MKHETFPDVIDVLLPVVGCSQKFPVRRVFCVGRNYAAHSLEMGHDPKREEPFFFEKSPHNLNTSGLFEYPEVSNDVHHEVELAVALRSGGRSMSVDHAEASIFGYATAIDMTLRDFQAEAKKKGRPWTFAKSFDGSAPIGPLFPARSVTSPLTGRLKLSVNKTVRQSGDLDQMIWTVPHLISKLSNFFELAGGDVLLTGTPAGVGPIKRGDTMTAQIAHMSELIVAVV